MATGQCTVRARCTCCMHCAPDTLGATEKHAWHLVGIGRPSTTKTPDQVTRLYAWPKSSEQHHRIHTHPHHHTSTEYHCTHPIFSSRVSLDTRSFTRSATESVGSQNGSPDDMLPGRQPQACPLGRFEPGSATAARSSTDNIVVLRRGAPASRSSRATFRLVRFQQ